MGRSRPVARLGSEAGQVSLKLLMGCPPGQAARAGVPCFTSLSSRPRVRLESEGPACRFAEISSPFGGLIAWPHAASPPPFLHGYSTTRGRVGGKEGTGPRQLVPSRTRTSGSPAAGRITGRCSKIEPPYDRAPGQRLARLEQRNSLGLTGAATPTARLLGPAMPTANLNRSSCRQPSA